MGWVYALTVPKFSTVDLMYSKTCFIAIGNSVCDVESKAASMFFLKAVVVKVSAPCMYAAFIIAE